MVVYVLGTNQALIMCNTHGLTGIDIDWEFPSYGQETAFKNFFKILYQTLNPAGYKVSAAAGGEGMWLLLICSLARKTLY